MIKETLPTPLFPCECVQLISASQAGPGHLFFIGEKNQLYLFYLFPSCTYSIYVVITSCETKWIERRGLSNKKKWDWRQQQQQLAIE